MNEKEKTRFDNWDSGTVEGELAEMYDDWQEERDEFIALLAKKDREIERLEAQTKQLKSEKRTR